MKKLIYYFVIAQLLIAHVVAAQNQLPIVNAGPDQTFLSTSTATSVTLTGSATDADGSIQSYLWTILKGPNTPITNPNQATITVSGLQKGVYIFRLTATDNQGAKKYDDVAVIYTQPIRKTHTQAADPTKEMYYWEYLPEDYQTSAATTKYPLLIFLHGCGERSYNISPCILNSNATFNQDSSFNGLNKILRHGPIREIAEGAKMCFKNPNNVEECFIVVSPQISARDYKVWTLDKTVENFLNTLFNTYSKIDQTRVYLTGTSIGGAGTYDFAQKNYSFSRYIAAIAPVAGKGSAPTACILRDRDIPVWGFHAELDNIMRYSDHKALIDNLTNCVPAPDPLPRFTVYPGRGHDDTFVFHSPYESEAPPDSRYPETLYTWFLQHSRSNVPPLVNAGPDKTITLPTNSVSITGTASDSDGTPSYKWTKTGGPSCTLGITTTPTLTVSNMVEGTYKFKLTATDIKGAAAYDEVSVVVKPVPASSGGSWLEFTSNGDAGKSILLFYDPPKDNSNQEPVDPVNNSLEFYIKNVSGPTPPQSLRVEITVKFISGSVLLGDYITTIAPQWTKVSIPLTAFNIAADRWNTGGVSQVKFKTISGFSPGVFGIDEIRFTSATTPLVWYGDAHQLSGTPEAVTEPADATFRISNRVTTGGAPTTPPAARIATARSEIESEDTETIENTLAEGNVVHVFNMQGYEVNTFVCPSNCCTETLAKITEHANGKGLYILHVTNSAGERTMVKVNVQ